MKKCTSFSKLDSIKVLQEFPDKLKNILYNVRNINRDMFKEIDPMAEENVTFWEKNNSSEALEGGGVITTFRGDILEKSAVNISFVKGPSYPASRDETFGGPFIAAGVSLISHPKNPYAPIAHMNIRYIKVGDQSDYNGWIGGGADLTPMLKFEEDTHDFFMALKMACETHPQANYERFKAWCDEYFYIKHRKEIRGIGGIFFDKFNINSYSELDLLNEIGKEFMDAYKKILKRRIMMPYSEEERNNQLKWRGRYVEFNLLYDRGTRFGLESGGNPDAIFSSLPPLVRW